MTRIRLSVGYVLIYYGGVIEFTLGAVSLGLLFGGARIWALGFAGASLSIGMFNYGLSLGRANASER